MGTNFYWIETRHEENDHILQHIGKRSAAGLYCYDCGTTLNRGGTDYIHETPKNELERMFNYWDVACPCCEKTKEETNLTNSTAGVEPGFSSTTSLSKSGVSTCCSFTWTLLKHKKEIEELAKTKPNEKVIIDEYGEELTAIEFIEMFEVCPIEFQSPSEFS